MGIRSNRLTEQKYEKYQSFLSENFQFMEVKFSIYLNRHVFVMVTSPLIVSVPLIYDKQEKKSIFKSYSREESAGPEVINLFQAQLS